MISVGALVALVARARSRRPMSHSAGRWATSSLLVRRRLIAGRLARHGTKQLGPVILGLQAPGPHPALALEALEVLLDPAEVSHVRPLLRAGLTPGARLEALAAVSMPAHRSQRDAAVRATDGFSRAGSATSRRTRTTGGARAGCAPARSMPPGGGICSAGSMSPPPAPLTTPSSTRSWLRRARDAAGRREPDAIDRGAWTRFRPA